MTSSSIIALAQLTDPFVYEGRSREKHGNFRPGGIYGMEIKAIF